MINMAVISLKDIIKYMIKITIVIAVVVGITKYVFEAKSSLQNVASGLENESFLLCLDTTVPRNSKH